MKTPPIFEPMFAYVDEDGRRRRLRKVRGWGSAEAKYWRDGGYAPPDSRYQWFYEYLLESPSFLAVQAKLRGESSPYPFPSDWDKVEPVARDFIDADPDLMFHDWWRKKGGLKLFSVRAPDPAVTAAVGRLSEKTRSLRLEWDGNDGVVIRVALNQSRKNAEKQISKLFDRLQFEVPVRASVAPKYVFLKNRIWESTLETGLLALFDQRSRNQAVPLWWIGNRLNLIPRQTFNQDEYDRIKSKELAERKRLLGIAAARLIKNAALIAENAARGRFPCADPFPEAQMAFFKRKAGRPRKEDAGIERLDGVV